MNGEASSYFKEIPCVVCNSLDFEVLYPSNIKNIEADLYRLFDFQALGYRPRYRLVKCGQCRHVYANPILRDDIVDKLYEGHTTHYTEQDITGLKQTMRGYISSLQPYLSGTESVLDVGCHNGLFLSVLQGHGVKKLHGVEPSGPDAAEAALRVPEAEIINNLYRAEQFPPGSFDLITCIHVLDHLTEPSEVLKAAAKHLKDNGVLFCVMHDMESLLSRVLGKRFPPIEIKHVSYFSKHSLAELLDRSGLRAVAFVNTYNVYPLSRYISNSPLPGKAALLKALQAIGADRLSLRLPLGNIGAVCTKATG